MSIEKTDAPAVQDVEPVVEEKEKGKPGRPKNCRGCRKPKTQCKCGRPCNMTPVVLAKLIAAFSAGANIEQACLMAGLNDPSVYYRYAKKNPGIRKAREKMKTFPHIVAMQRIIQTIMESKEEVALEEAWKIIDKFGHPDMEIYKPSDQRAQSVAGGPVLVGPSPQLNVNYGTQNLIHAEDLTDDQCLRMAQGESLASVIGEGNQIASVPRDE